MGRVGVCMLCACDSEERERGVGAGANATMMPEPELGQAGLISEPMTLPSSQVEEEGSYHGC